MLSVILINSKIYDRYVKYDYFFNWFEDNSDVAVCIWNKNVSENADIDELAPQLFDLVKNETEWNAYVIDEPFVSSDYMEKDFENLTQHSINPYERANTGKEYDPSNDPLMRLVYFLGGRGYEQLQYINAFGFRAVRPNQIFLLTPRIFENLSIQKKILQSEIEEKNRQLLSESASFSDNINVVSLRSSEFWSRYEYPANCRFMVFDMPDILNVKYDDSWFLFWLATMTLVINKYDSTEIGAYKLHLVSLDLSMENLDDFINKFYMALRSACDVSQKDIENEISEIKTALEDTTANHPDDCAPVYVNFPDTEFSEFYAQNEDFGNTKDKPRLDTEIWHEHQETVKEETARMFKAINRGKNEAVDAMNRTFAVDLPLLKNQRLSRYDAEDIAEALDKSEIEMLDLKTDRYASRVVFEENENLVSEDVKQAMVGRVMTKTYGLLTAVGVLVCLFGFIPFIVSSARFSLSSCIVAVLITLFSCGCVALASYISLKVLRRKFKKVIDEYNDKLTENIQVIQDGAQIQSQYLSKLLNYMEKYQMLISGRIEEHHLKHLEELTQINAMYQDAIDQCKSIAGLCHVKLKSEEISVDPDRIIFMPGKKIYLHEETDMLHIPLNSIQDRLVPPFPFVDALHISEEKVFESSSYYGVEQMNDAAAKAEKGEI